MKVPLTPLRFLQYAERQYRDRTAVVCGEKRFSYAQFARRVGQMAGLLRATGIAPGDRVALLGVNSHRLLEAYYGVPEAGAILLPLNIRLSAEELGYVLNDAGASALLFDEQFLPVVETLRPELKTVRTFVQMGGLPARDWLLADSYEHLLATAVPYRIDITSVDEDQVAELFYTSGTSAQPKGVMLTHRNIYLHALQACLAIGGGSGSVELHTHSALPRQRLGCPALPGPAGRQACDDRALRPTRRFSLDPGRAGAILQGRANHGHAAGQSPPTAAASI